MSVNKAILLGHVGADPEIRYIGDSGNSVKVAQFSVATTKRYRKSSGEDAEDTQWHTVLSYRSLADVAEKYIRKGTLLFVEGEIRHRSYTDRTGSVKWVTEILAGSLQLLGGRPDPVVRGARELSESARPAPEKLQPKPAPKEIVGIEADDDLPF